MAIITYPLNGIDYLAENAETYLCTRISGVYAQDHFPISITGNLVLTVGPGLAWIRNEDFAGKSVAVTASETLTFSIGDTRLPRIDRVVLRFDKSLNASFLLVKEGTPSANPSPPPVERTAIQYELGLATVRMPAGSYAITSSQITSTLLDETVCGLMRDGVTRIPTEQLHEQVTSILNDLEINIQTVLENADKQVADLITELQNATASAKEAADQTQKEFQEHIDGLIDEGDALIETIKTDYREEITQFEDEQEAEFNTWFESIKDILDADTAGNLLQLVQELQEQQPTKLVATLPVYSPLPLLSQLFRVEGGYGMGAFGDGGYGGGAPETVPSKFVFHGQSGVDVYTLPTFPDGGTVSRIGDGMYSIVFSDNVGLLAKVS